MTGIAWIYQNNNNIDNNNDKYLILILAGMKITFISHNIFFLLCNCVIVWVSYII